MGFFLFSFIQILNDSRRPKVSHSTPTTARDVIGGFLGAIFVVVILGGWFVGIPYYLHVIQGFSGWATFGLWWLITAAVAAVFSVLSPNS